MSQEQDIGLEAVPLVKMIDKHSATDAALRPKRLNELTAATIEASETLMESLARINKAREAFEPIHKDFIALIRQFRMGSVTELATIRKELEELRKFLLSDTHETEIKRLREFVELCERLKALKDSGFLDTVADTILKLA